MGILSPRRLRAAAFPVLVAGVLATMLALPGVAIDADTHSQVGRVDTVRPAAAPATEEASAAPVDGLNIAEAGAAANYGTLMIENQYADAVRQNQFLDAASRLLQERAATVSNRSGGVAVSSGGGNGRCNGDVGCFLACTRAHESDSAGGYSAVGGGGRYRGAYQFDQQTWNNNAAASGRLDLVGQDPAAVAPAAQDQVAADTYARRGNQPWGGRC
jgi:hypothetical protein